ncbi:hypothetical protein J437_LFUL001032 [Ladona fulva]|uniref:HTH psq-type domain-containing protein n=1 Tax=Ladona fulva TaxID=123851 RepID=A0A8K0KGL2_LADFU|nr:hypothetical protein J437_LFUL001032 [Ladona fulva]
MLNVGTMNGKSREIVDLISRRKVNILCIQETRWKGNKAKELAEGYKLIYSGTDEKGRNGVGVIIDKELKGGIYEVERKSDRIMCVKLEIGRGSTTIVCGYVPQAGCEEEEKNVGMDDRRVDTYLLLLRMYKKAIKTPKKRRIRIEATIIATKIPPLASISCATECDRSALVWQRSPTKPGGHLQHNTNSFYNVEIKSFLGRDEFTEIRSGEMSQKQAADQYNISRTTIKR